MDQIYLQALGMDGSLYDDIEISNANPEEIVIIHDGVLEYSNNNDTWLQLYINDQEVQLLKPGCKGTSFMFPVRKGDRLRIFGPGNNYGISGKVYYKIKEGIEEKIITLPSDPNTWVDFLMDLSNKVDSFKIETNCGSILIYSDDTINQGSKRLSYFSTKLEKKKCFHDTFTRKYLEQCLPLSNIKEVTAVYKY